jgi:hypothetical protein
MQMVRDARRTRSRSSTVDVQQKATAAACPQPDSPTTIPTPCRSPGDALIPQPRRSGRDIASGIR